MLTPDHAHFLSVRLILWYERQTRYRVSGFVSRSGPSGGNERNERTAPDVLVPLPV